MSSAALATTFSYLIAAGCGLCCLKLWRTGLARSYRGLLAFLLFTSLYSWLNPVFQHHFNGRIYLWFWALAQPVTWFLSVWVVLELYSMILVRHKGLATFGRRLQYGGFAVSTLISLIVMIPEIRNGSGHTNPLLLYIYAVERGLDCGMLVFLVCMLLWITRYPLPLSRNLILHSAIYSVLFLSNSLGMFAQVFLGTRLSEPVSTALMGVLAVCVFTWLAFLSPKGEEIQFTVPNFTPDEEERMIQQLEALNRTLLKISRN